MLLPCLTSPLHLFFCIVASIIRQYIALYSDSILYIKNTILKLTDRVQEVGNVIFFKKRMRKLGELGKK